MAKMSLKLMRWYHMMFTLLYENISLIDMLKIIKDYFPNDDQLTMKTAVPQNKFLDLVNLVLTST